jgi:hypothetical protein
MRERIRSLANADFDFELLTPVLHWTNSVVPVPNWTSERVLLAGDAAHGMPPTGGFGMNTGFIDLYELGWRLEALVKGWGGAQLLTSYASERRSAVSRISDMATAIYRDWLEWAGKLKTDAGQLIDESASGAAMRTDLGRQLVATFSREFNCNGAPLGYRYEDSPLCIPDGTAAPADSIEEYIPTARPGHRAPHAWIDSGRSTLDCFGRAFVLFNFSPDGFELMESFAREATSLNIPLTCETIKAHAVAQLYGSKFVLVRPDGIVAWRSDSVPTDIATILLKVSGH